jgi:SAM-dependent methyltransferase
MSKLESLIQKVVPEKVFNNYLSYKRQKQINLYSGRGVQCPICKSEFKSFASFGRDKRKNARCLSCDSLERHRLVWKYMIEKKDILGKKPGGKIRLMHFGPEKSFYDILSENPNIEYVPCDYVPEQYTYAEKIPLTKVDVTDIPFGDNHFDAILCTHVLEHIPDDIKAMSELRRVMKPGGWGIFQVPIDYSLEKTYEDFSITSPSARKKAFGRASHVRWYGQDYKDRLKSVGFKVIEDDYVKHFSAEDLHRFGFIPSELIYYCEK